VATTTAIIFIGEIMGQAAEDILDGIVCCVCGAYHDKFLNEDDFDGYGMPTPCDNCKENK